jgi:hypothetical protein
MPSGALLSASPGAIAPPLWDATRKEPEHDQFWAEPELTTNKSVPAVGNSLQRTRRPGGCPPTSAATALMGGSKRVRAKERQKAKGRDGKCALHGLVERDDEGDEFKQPLDGRTLLGLARVGLAAMIRILLHKLTTRYIPRTHPTHDTNDTSTHDTQKEWRGTCSARTRESM